MSVEFTKESITECAKRHGLTVKEFGENFQIGFDKVALGKTRDPQKMRILIAFEDECVASGLHAESRLTHKNQAGQWVAFPCVWVNKEAREDRNAQRSTVDAAIMAELKANRATIALLAAKLGVDVSEVLGETETQTESPEGPYDAGESEQKGADTDIPF